MSAAKVSNDLEKETRLRTVLVLEDEVLVRMVVA